MVGLVELEPRQLGRQAPLRIRGAEIRILHAREPRQEPFLGLVERLEDRREGFCRSASGDRRGASLVELPVRGAPDRLLPEELEDWLYWNKSFSPSVVMSIAPF